jgi:integrase
MTKKSASVQRGQVKLREKKLKDGSSSLYLDINMGGKRHKEYLKLYLVEPTTTKDRELNKSTLAAANARRAQRELEIINGKFDISTPKTKGVRFLDYYRKMCADRLKTPDSKGNWGNWHSCLKHLEVYCDEATTFDEIDAEWIQGFKDYLNSAEKDAQKKRDPKVSYVFEGLSQNSKVSYFNKLRACINQAYEERIIQKNPLRGIEGFKQEEVEREYLTLEEVKKLAATPCNYPILKASFLFSCLTGLRKSDIERLTWGEVRKFGNFTRIVFKQKKTGGQEYLDISDQAAAYLGTRRNDVDRVFEGFTYGSWTSLELKRWALAAGITKNITFHCGRHTFAVMMLDLGADIYTVSKLLGHRELATTQIYAKVLDKNKQAAVNLIPDINK